MLRIVRERYARADILDIWIYIARDSVGAADRLNDELLAKFSMLAEYPLAGRERPELAAQLRSFPVGSYVIYYRAQPDRLEIVRVLHGAIDVDGDLFSD